MRPLSFALPLALAALLPLAGCDFETSIPIDPPPYEKQLVVLAFPSPDTTWSVSVGRTTPLGGGSDVDVRDATVMVYEDGVFLETLQIPEPTPQRPELPPYLPTEYVSPSGLRPEAGRTYRVEVSAPGFPDASGETTVPLAPEAEVLRDEWTREPGDFGEGERSLSFALQDAPGESIYELALILRQEYNDFQEYPTRFTSVSPSFREGYDLIDIDVGVETDAEYFGAVVFRDRLFPDRRRTFDLRFDTYSTPEVPITYALVLSIVSEPFAEYQISRSQQENNEGNPFAEPTPLYSNVEGGHGAVGGFATVRFELPDPPRSVTPLAAR